MKNTIKLLVAVLLIACGLPSCGNTLVKRQHGPGYYINKNPRIPNAESERNDNKHIKPRTTNAENSHLESEPPSDEQPMLVRPANEEVIQSEINDQPTVTSEETALKTVRLTTVANDELKPAKPSLVEWASKTRLAKKMNLKASTKQSNSARNSDDGLSLFGIIILILIVLWLVGAISGGWGLGGLIHILLVLALILLILWLLRII